MLNTAQNAEKSKKIEKSGPNQRRFGKQIPGRPWIDQDHAEIRGHRFRLDVPMVFGFDVDATSLFLAWAW